MIILARHCLVPLGRNGCFIAIGIKEDHFVSDVTVLSKKSAGVNFIRRDSILGFYFDQTSPRWNITILSPFK